MNAIYVRCSTDEQRTNKNIQSQLDVVQKFLKENNHSPAEVYQDDGWSGSTTERPSLDQLRNDIRDGKVDNLFIYSHDRLSREQTDMFILLREFERQGVKLIVTTQPNLNDLPEIAQIMIKGNYAQFSEIERLIIRDRTRRGRLSKVSKGFIMTSRAPFGFRYITGNKDKKTQGYFTHNPEEIETVKLILGWAMEGKSQREIIRLLEEKKIKTRNGKDTWQKSTIAKILTINIDSYAGVWSYLKYQAIEPKEKTKRYYSYSKSSRKLRAKDAWMAVDISDLAIITKQEVEIIRRKQQLNRGMSMGNTKYNYLLQKMIYHNCGHRFIVDSYHGRAYYRCRCTKKESIKSETIETQVWNDIKSLISQPKLLMEQAREFISSKRDDGVVRLSQTDELSKKRQALNIENERLVSAFREGIITMDDLKTQKQKIQDKENLLNEQELELTNNAKKLGQIDLSNFETDLTSLITDLQTVLSKTSKEERRQLLKWWGVKVTYTDYNYALEGFLPYYNGLSRASSSTQRSTGCR